MMILAEKNNTVRMALTPAVVKKTVIMTPAVIKNTVIMTQAVIKNTVIMTQAVIKNTVFMTPAVIKNKNIIMNAALLKNTVMMTPAVLKNIVIMIPAVIKNTANLLSVHKFTLPDGFKLVGCSIVSPANIGTCIYSHDIMCLYLGLPIYYCTTETTYS